MIAIQSNSIIASDLEWRSVISPAILLVNVVCAADARSPSHFLFTISNLVDLLASSNSKKKDNLITKPQQQNTYVIINFTCGVSGDHRQT